VRVFKKTVAVVFLAVLLCGLSVACKTRSAWNNVISERARWTVLALDWTQRRDNTVLLSTRLSGPPNSALDTLTVRIILRDAAGATIAETWHVYDLEPLPRGGPKDFTLRIPASGPVDGLVVDTVPRPVEADQPHIPELRGLAR